MQMEFEFVLPLRTDRKHAGTTPLPQGNGPRGEGRRGQVPGVSGIEPAFPIPRLAGDALRAELARCTGLKVSLTITDNRSRVLSFRYGPSEQTVCVRLHHMFLSAEPEVVRALAHWIKHPRSKKKGQVIDEFIQANHHRVRSAKKRDVPVNTRGVFFDLRAMFDQLNREYFDGAVTAVITWGGMPNGTRRRRSIRYGSYSEEDHLIRIHPLLDQKFVPAYFVRYIVFHEMLHAHLGIEEAKTPSGRRRVHSPEFKRRERAYPDYFLAIAWQDKPANLRRLLRGRAKPSAKVRVPT